MSPAALPLGAGLGHAGRCDSIMLAMQRGRKSASALATVPFDGRPSLLRPPASLSEAERTVFIHTVTAVKPEHFRPGDEPLLMRYCEVVALCDHAAKKLAADIAKGRPSQWLTVQERLLKMLVVLCRQLRLSPLARTPSKNGRPEIFDPHRNGHAVRLSDETQ